MGPKRFHLPLAMRRIHVRHLTSWMNPKIMKISLSPILRMMMKLLTVQKRMTHRKEKIENKPAGHDPAKFGLEDRTKSSLRMQSSLQFAIESFHYVLLRIPYLKSE